MLADSVRAMSFMYDAIPQRCRCSNINFVIKTVKHKHTLKHTQKMLSIMLTDIGAATQS